MANLLLFMTIFGLISAIILIPFSKTKDGLDRVVAIIATLVMVVIVFGFYYLTNADRNFSTLWFFAALITILGFVTTQGKERLIKLGLVIASFVYIAILILAPIFNAEDKHQLAMMDEKVEIEIFDENVTPASVPPQFAHNKMRKAFGQVPDTSYYELGNLQIQKVNGEFVYVAPVEFSGFFKWLNGNVTPGYFLLSATDSSANPTFIEEEMAYTPSSYFNKNIYRHIRMQYPKHIFKGDVQLEVDDQGVPHYIRTFGDFVSARSGFEAKGIVMVNPKTGKTSTFTLENVPEFIDGAISPEAVSLQNSYYGKYVHGFWNSVFGKSDVKLPSDEGTEANVSPIFDENGQMFYFTDFTSPKEGVDSMLGYSLTNARTGDATFYTGNQQASYMDSQGALQIIEKKFIEKQWYGKMPIIYNFYGEASWLSPVLDSNGFLQNYFIVSAANPEISVYADTPNQALKKYKTALQRTGSTVDGSSDATEKQVSGTVVRVYKEKYENQTIISFLLDNRNNYLVSSEIDPLVIYLQEGDQVRVTYLDTGEIFLPVKELLIEGLQ